MAKYGHVPLIFLNLYCNGLNKFVDILQGSMHVSIMYSDRVCVFVWCMLASAAKTAYLCHLKKEWEVTIFVILQLNFKALFHNYKLLSLAIFVG